MNIESTTAHTIADQKLVIEKPGESDATISKEMALTININNPKVRIVKGNAIRLRIGLTMVLIMPKISAVTIMAPLPVN